MESIDFDTVLTLGLVVVTILSCLSAIYLLPWGEGELELAERASRTVRRVLLPPVEAGEVAVVQV